MDDTQQSRVSDAAATRKRRSSILKSQRPPRTPFSELEFNVATPTDTAKSRRVSFSRRTGVAEFVTNEATTTWKNFYEEHNKSLESSGNESGANHQPRPPVGHLGKRIFDQQFQEVEAVDLVSTLESHSSRNVNASMSNANFTQQLASLECTGNDNLPMPAQNFEMSAFTDQQSKMFGDDLAVPTMGEMSGRIDINFSAIQCIGDVKDDLDEIQKDLQRAQSNVVCPGPFTGRKSLSEYIEVDLNATHVTIKNDDDDMSITDTIHSPKVQDVSKNLSASLVDKKASFNKDWVADKENIALNPYVTPKETTNFAINDESDKILVFDGKRLTIQSDREADLILKNSNENVPPPKEAKPHQRKTIVLNVNDDLPNFVDEPMSTSVGMLGTSFKRSVMYDDDDISITQPVDANIDLIPERNVTVVKEKEIGDISLTQAVCNVILPDKPEKRRTIVFDNDNCDISVTQALPSKIIGTDSNKLTSERRRTILYENDTANISITQAIPANIIVGDIQKQVPERRRTILYEKETADLSMTQAIPANIIMNDKHNNMNNENNSTNEPLGATAVSVSEKNVTVVNENEIGDISFTQAISRVILPAEPQKRRTIVFDNDNCDISVTQALPANIFGGGSNETVPERRKTIVFESETGDISMTQAIPANIIVNENQKNMPERRRTILYDNDTADISMTQAIPANIIVNEKPEMEGNKNNEVIVMLSSVPQSVLPKVSSMPERSNIVVNVDDKRDRSITTAVSNVISPDKPEKRRTIVFDNDDCDISMTQAIPSNIINEIKSDKAIVEKRRTIVYEDEMADISVTQAIPVNIIMNENNAVNKDVSIKEELLEKSVDKPDKTHTEESEIQDLKSEPDCLEGDIVAADLINNESNMSIKESCHSVKIQDVSNNCSFKQVDKNSIFNNEQVVDKDKIALNPDVTPKESINSDLSNESDKILMFDGDRLTIKSDKQANRLLKCIKDLKPESKEPIRNTIVLNVNADMPNYVEQPMTASIGLLANTSMKRSIMYDNDVSLTISNPSNVYSQQEKSITEVNDDENDNVSNTNAIIPSDKRKTIEYDDNNSNISVSGSTQSKMLETDSDIMKTDRIEVIQPKLIEADKSLLERSRTIPIVNDLENTSTTQIGSTDIMSEEDHKNNETNELLEMISNLTDTRHSIDTEKPAERIESFEPRRLSVAPNRLSIVLSREDLLNNISMAQAALQRSIEMDESLDETISDTPVEVETPPKKAARVSNEVVKKLQFEDESASETSVKSELKSSPLRKTAFGETSYMKESKGKVIPGYLKDVTDDLKALMSDLVKPNADAVPFVAPDKNLKREASTCSTQIQANLITSSQIDIDPDMTSVTDSAYDLDKVSMPSIDRSQSLRSSLKSDVEKHYDDLPEISFRPKRCSASPPVQERVLVFDHNNPLNNICLAPFDFSDAHRYNPPKSHDDLSVESQSIQRAISTDSGENMNSQFVANVKVTRTMQPSGDSAPDKSDAQSLLSNASKRASIDESISVRVCELKDTKVNTVIAMKANKDLLEASSSLTLVDDALARNNFDVDLDMETAQSSTSTNAKQNSPVRIIYQDQNASEKVDSDLTSNEGANEHNASTKAKKRNYSPTKRDKQKYSALSALDITPKPISKMQKLSTSPSYSIPEAESIACTEVPEKLGKDGSDCSKSADESSMKEKRSPRLSISPKTKRPGTNVTVQQLITEYDIDPEIDQNALNKEIIRALSVSGSSTVPDTMSVTDVPSVKSPEAVSSFTSSKNQNEMREACSVTTSEAESMTTSSRSRSTKMDWQPELTETSSNMISECESSVNVVAKIDMLPFMGSNECEWEASGVDAWSFRLLHGRLRLGVRLAHRHDNATRTRVRADTPVLRVALDAPHRDKKNSVAMLCVGFAAEAMRYFIGQGCARAGDVPALLKRCAGVARVALRWGRAMHEARLHLAYTLSADGCLQLKVANTALRSVWEVSMQLELVVEDAREAPWPRAGRVRVAPVVSDSCGLADRQLRRLLAALPRDWGHAPRTIWKIFRYLKNKTREDDLLGV